MPASNVWSDVGAFLLQVLQATRTSVLGCTRTPALIHSRISTVVPIRVTADGTSHQKMTRFDYPCTGGGFCQLPCIRRGLGEQMVCHKSVSRETMPWVYAIGYGHGGRCSKQKWQDPIAPSPSSPGFDQEQTNPEAPYGNPLAHGTV